mmetsp:Transcript_14803/g.16005  ORF Transcript_14803/g.16005 Transcript_14803/m.16005 type:complete len:333 (+) Transcript_14803:57-1055(+)|eukprot:gene459-493_t
MRAVSLNQYVHSFGELSVSNVSKPSARPGFAVVKVKIAAGNPVDKVIAGGYLVGFGWDWPKPFTLGTDFSGIVEAVGEGVTNVNVGDAVFSSSWGQGKPFDDEPNFSVAGAFAEYISIPAEKLSKKPDAVSFEVAASIGVVGTTAHQALVEIGKITKGTRVLIFGGSSAVGVFAIQLAKAYGAHVTTTASSRSIAFVQGFNAADKIINYNETKWEEDPELKSIDVIFDTVGEKDALQRALASGVAKTGGVFVTIAEFSVGYDPTAHPPLAFAAVINMKQNTAVQDELAEHIVQGKIKVPIEETFPFTTDGVVGLLNKIAGGKSLGKNILSIE